MLQGSAQPVINFVETTVRIARQAWPCKPQPTMAFTKLLRHPLSSISGADPGLLDRRAGIARSTNAVARATAGQCRPDRGCQARAARALAGSVGLSTAGGARARQFLAAPGGHGELKEILLQAGGILRLHMITEEQSAKFFPVRAAFPAAARRASGCRSRSGRTTRVPGQWPDRAARSGQPTCSQCAVDFTAHVGQLFDQGQPSPFARGQTRVAGRAPSWFRHQRPHDAADCFLDRDILNAARPVPLGRPTLIMESNSIQSGPVSLG